MKKLHVFQLVLSTALLFLVGCGANKMINDAGTIAYEVSPKPLVMEGDSVDVSITIKYPPKFFNKNAVVVVTPVIEWQGGNAAFDKVTLQGEKVQGNGYVISNESGGTYTYTGSVPYEEGMIQSDLVLKSTVSVKGKEAVALPEAKIAEGVIATAALLKNEALDISAASQFQRRQVVSNEAQINFLISQAKIRNSELSDEDFKEMKEFIKEASSNDDMEMKNAQIFGYASPDGPQEQNVQLAEDRKDAAENVVSKDVKAEILGTAAGEDWDGFRELMQASDMENKDVIISVLSKYSDPAVREAEIKKMSSVYKKLADEILPELRRSKIVVNADKLGRSDSLIIALGLKSELAEDTLSVDEYLHGATVAENDDDAVVILKNAAEIYSDSWKVFNNLGCLYLDQDKLNDARQAFDNADNLSEGDKAVKNNLGVLAVKEGDLDKALEYFEIAQGAGSEVKYNMGVIKVKEGDYSSAVSMFGSNATFNAALAKLLSGDVDGATQTITKSGDESAEAYYLKAVIGARTSNIDMIVSNLREAIEKDASLRERAQKDLEFRDFASNADFKAVVK
ncbi:MAG: tetratricopeptide repeat protein [Bacteroidota bacterium]